MPHGLENTNAKYTKCILNMYFNYLHFVAFQ